MYDNDNNLNSNEDVVFKKWSEDFQTLYDNSSVYNEFDEQFYENIIREKDFLEGHMLDPLYEENLFLKKILSLEEVESVVMAAKSGKSVGIDKIPVLLVYCIPCLTCAWTQVSFQQLGKKQ